MRRKGDPVDVVRRHATVLSVDIRSSVELKERLKSREDGEDLGHEIMRDCVSGLERVARRHGAGIFASRGDGGIATFGLPVAYEGTKRAAINAAIDMLESISQIDERYETPIPIAVSIGIASGIVGASDFSGTDQISIDVTGAAADLAARLRELAQPGEVYVSRSVHQDTDGDYSYDSRGAHALKGFSHPFDVFALLSRRPHFYRSDSTLRGRLTAELVDRIDARRELRQRLRQLQDGKGSVVAISGGIGVGKSRIIQEAARLEESAHVEWHEGRCYQMGVSIPYHPFRDLLRSWAGIVEQGIETASTRLETALQDLLPEQDDPAIAFLMSMADVPLPERYALAIEAVSPDKRWNMNFKGFHDWLAALSSRSPVVLVLEDLHWSDSSSLNLIRALANAVQRMPILLILLYRPENDPTNEAIDEALRSCEPRFATSLHIDALTEDETRQLLEQLIGGGRLPDAIRDDLERLSEGNPLFLEEFLHELIDRRAIHVDDSGLTPVQLEAVVKIPAKVNEALMARIDRLPAEQRVVIETASVIGQTFYLSVLRELFQDPEKLVRDLDSLSELELLTRNPREKGVEYAFRHSVVQETAYESIGVRKRKQLHLKVAHAIEAHLGTANEGTPAMLAYHYGKADRIEEAEEHLFQAGEQAARISASEEESYFFRRASEVLRASDTGKERTDRLARIERQLASLDFNRGRLAASNHHFQNYLKYRGYNSPRSLIAQLAVSLRVLVSAALESRGIFRSRTDLPASKRDNEVIHVMFDRARAETQAMVGDFVPHSLETLGMIRRFDPKTVEGVGGMLAGAIGIFTFGGLAPRISEYFLELGDSLASDSDLREQMLLRSMRFFHKFFSGDWSEEFTLPESLVESALRLGSLWDVSTYLGVLGKRRVHEGRLTEADTSSKRLLRIEEEYNYKIAKENRLAVETILAIEKGDFDRALSSSRTYLALLRDDGPRMFAMGFQAKIYVQRGELDQAENVIRRAEKLAAKLAIIPPFHLSSVRRSRLLLEVHRVANGSRVGLAGRRALRIALRTAERVPCDRPEVLRLASEMAFLSGHKRKCIRLASEAEAANQTLGTRPEHARLKFLKARIREMGWGPETTSAEELRADAARFAAEHKIDWSSFEAR